jgi:hypothetical protein
MVWRDTDDLKFVEGIIAMELTNTMVISVELKLLAVVLVWISRTLWTSSSREELAELPCYYVTTPNSGCSDH